MALSGLEIYKLLPKTNCKDCGFPTCLAFAMQLAAKKASLDKCPHVSAEAKQALEGASQPPIKLVTVGTGDGKLQIGNETVMFRHEETFHHPAGVGFLIEDSLDDAALKKKLDKINKLQFERVGQRIGANVVAIKSASGDAAKFSQVVKSVCGSTKLNIVLVAEDPKVLAAGVEASKDRRPLLHGANKANVDEMVKVAKGAGLPLVAVASGLEEIAELTQKIKAAGVEEIVIDTGPKDLTAKVNDLTYARRMALRKTFRPLGYPAIAFTTSSEPADEIAEAASFISKYAGIVIMKNCEPEEVLPILATRQDLYNDPQKPVQVEPKVYDIGNVTKESPLIVTTNFSITYYTVAGEVEASKVPTRIMACDAEGMSVLTAWAAEKFTPETITRMLGTVNADSLVSHHTIVIPGYVAVMSGKLEEGSGWKIQVGPREASGLPNYLKNFKV
ncbi:MAG: acetyl-CoA decarbonylase/synthase complex subunit gamma [Candidatus Omnitrophica bacterium]|nr:acetyl-CoA decarbonylase/synthase complex subunit gamma [Candidatus Omnitrophota bacterium]